MNITECISIIVPVYNCEKYIAKCIKSIQKQTYQNWNLILVDDGSVDSSRQICDQFAGKDNRITVIHQINKGSVEARKAGVLSLAAQKNPWIMMCDADDTMPADALEKLYCAAKKYGAEMVVGQTVRMFKGVYLPSKWKSPCFQIQEPKLYNHQQIIDELFISYFGITNFPVTLYAKLYRTEQLTRAIDFAPVVRFMGDDLSVSIRITPEVKNLVVIPDVVYNYRIGGGTSKFMPYMMDDFARLYTYKRQFAEKYPMPQDVQFYMDVELMNTTKSHFLQCLTNGGFTEAQLVEEVKKVMVMPQVKQASGNLAGSGRKIAEYAENLLNGNIEPVVRLAYETRAANRKRELFKRVLQKF